MRISRRDALALGGTTAINVVTAGCTSLRGRSGTTDGTTVLDQVPAGVSAVAHADVAAVRGDAAARRVIDAAFGSLAGRSDGSEDNRTVFDRFGTRTGLDPAGVEATVGFGTHRPDDGRPSAGVRIEADWTTADLRAAFARFGVDLTRRTYREQPLYEPPDGGPWLGVVSSDSYAIGSAPAVRAAIDVDSGRIDAVGGGLRSHFPDAGSTLFSAAVAVPDDGFAIEPIDIGGMIDPGQFVAVTHATATVSRDEDAVSTAARLFAESAGDAKDVKAALEGAIAAGRELTETAQQRRALAAVTVEQRAATVIIDVSGPVELAAAAAETAGTVVRGLFVTPASLLEALLPSHE